MTETSVASLDGRHVDVAIVGAGINGSSAAQHLAAAGYRVLVVDQDDFADGATGRSSRLLHCGLRHLATGSTIWSYLLRPDRFAHALGIGAAAMAARDEIVRTSPSRVRAFEFCLPIYADDPYAPWQLRRMEFLVGTGPLRGCGRCHGEKACRSYAGEAIRP